MGPLDLLIHLLNFVAPAVCLALLTPLAGRLFVQHGAVLSGWWAQVAINFIVGVAVLLAGLWVYGRDGKMGTYAALVAACALSQWILLRGWRK